jgi:hypothetical protein
LALEDSEQNNRNVMDREREKSARRFNSSPQISRRAEFNSPHSNTTGLLQPGRGRRNRVIVTQMVKGGGMGVEMNFESDSMQINPTTSRWPCSWS